jgi:hypothetical protein
MVCYHTKKKRGVLDEREKGGEDGLGGKVKEPETPEDE